MSGSRAGDWNGSQSRAYRAILDSTGGRYWIEPVAPAVEGIVPLGAPGPLTRTNQERITQRDIVSTVRHRRLCESHCSTGCSS